MNKKQKRYYSHLTIEDRLVIQTGIENGARKSDIAKTLGKDATTIAKEIRSHLTIKPRREYYINSNNGKSDKCSRRDRTPGACNGCDTLMKCKKERRLYDANKAQKEYEYTLVDSRSGINMTTSERRRVADIIKPLIEQRQSIEHILMNHPEVGLCAKTLYSYIEAGVFHDFGIINLSLKEKVQRKYKNPKYKKRKEPVSYEGHRYDDYLKFKEEYEEIMTTEMDTLYNNSSGPYLQTFQFTDCKVMIGKLCKEKTSENMVGTIDEFEESLSSKSFEKLFRLLLTDRGSEFQKVQLFEQNKKGKHRLNIFYCDPMCSFQKPHVENNHNYVRDILPNGYPMEHLNQDDIDLMFTHINNTPRRSLHGKTPLEMMKFFYPEEYDEIIEVFKLRVLHPDEVTLSPLLFKKK